MRLRVEIESVCPIFLAAQKHCCHDPLSGVERAKMTSMEKKHGLENGDLGRLGVPHSRRYGFLVNDPS